MMKPVLGIVVVIFILSTVYVSLAATNMTPTHKAMPAPKTTSTHRTTPAPKVTPTNKTTPVHIVDKATEETVHFGRFGKVVLYHQTPTPAQVVLFVSGDGGWNLGVIDMARELATMDMLVVGIDITSYLKQLAAANENCSYPAADFEALSKFVQKTLGFKQYVPPILVGYSSGATLVYATLVQAPTGTFAGAISMGFCPDLPLNKPFCKGSGLAWEPGPKGKGYSFLPAPKLQTPWIAFQGTVDQVCDPTAVENYVKHVGQAEIVILPKVGHGFSVPKNWLPQFKQAVNDLGQKASQTRTPEAPAVQDLPLVEVPAQGTNTDVMAVLITGDGGWAGIDRDIAASLSVKGIAVVGWNSLQYFWTKRTPDVTAQDLERILRHYLTTWKKSSALLIGYSLGADVLPFMVSRLPKDLRTGVKLVTLLGVSHSVDFEFHLINWIGGGPSKTALPILPEIQKITELPLLCVYGEEETDSLCSMLKQANMTASEVKGGHHFSGDYQALTELILKHAKLP